MKINNLNSIEKSLSIFNEKPEFWEFLLLSEWLNIEISSAKSILESKLNTQPPLNKIGVRNLDDLIGMLKNIQSYSQEYLRFLACFDEISSKNEKVFGPPGGSGYPVEIVFLAKKIAIEYQKLYLFSIKISNERNNFDVFFNRNIDMENNELLLIVDAIGKGYFFVENSLKRLQIFFEDASEAIKSTIISKIENTTNHGKTMVFSGGSSADFVKAANAAARAIDTITTAEYDVNSYSKASHSLPDFLEWLAKKNSFQLPEIRKILLPLDLFPDAIIDDINERALDMCNDFAINEDNGKLTINKDIYLKVISNWNH